VTTEHGLVPRQPQRLKKVNQQLAIRRQQGYEADYVPHWGLDEIKQLITAADKERDRLLVEFLFDSCCRVSEAISIRPQDIVGDSRGWQVRVLGKGRKRSAVAISASLAAQLQSYCYRKSIPPDRVIFDVNASRVFQIIKKLVDKAGLVKPDGVGTVHILRHSGAIERLRQTGNPKAVQDQLRHKSALMTLRYMKTLSHEESLAIQQQVDFQW
jgi:integrase